MARTLLLLLALLAAGCEKPSPDLAGTWTDGEAVLEVRSDKSFALEEDGSSLEGTVAKVGATVYVQPATLNGMSLDEITVQAMDDAAKLGKLTDLEGARYRLEARKCTLTDPDTLQMAANPPPKGVPALRERTLRRTQAAPVE